jgi:hypothetical protein
LEVTGLSRGACRLCLQGQRISQGRNQLEAGNKQRHVPAKHWLTFNGLDGGVSQNTELFIPRIFCCLIHNKTDIHRNAKCFLAITEGVNLDL